MKWTLFYGSNCPKCGGDCEVLTDSKEQNWIYDGEEARCTDCDNKGYAECDGEIADIIWDQDCFGNKIDD